MAPPPRLTLHVVRVLLELDHGTRYGLELARVLGIKGGSLYPVLERLEQAGWITGSWEQIDPRAEGRPARHYYELTELGSEQLREVLDSTGLQPYR